MLKKRFLALTAFCAVMFVGVVALAMIMTPDQSPDPNRQSTYNRKSGDMWIGWGGTRRVRSGRVGSTGNRSVVGGGMRGGK